ncbi:MAG: right-handed parallel beta-helix repeat-containing protein [Betaproteobacteria bacterium]|nr:right-handed parallel beta-helix repeat-containing protein [Betaproteobacteria bacterium]
MLRLAPGVYNHGLNVHRLEGAEGRPIVIRGAAPPRRTVFVASAGRNTLSIVDSAHVTVSDLTLMGRQVPVDAVKAEGHARYARHITLERLLIEGYDAGQQNVAISTKCPAWNWTIRDNRIEGAGTGIYLGNSDGSAPFVRGVIEGNVIVGTRGYSMQIKHQREWPDVVGAAGERGETIIRYNTFAKDARSSAAELARPNLLLGHWPLVGRGSTDRYLVYGNLFLDNPSEALLQAEGNVVLYNNVFVNRHGDGVMLREHNDVPRAIDVFGNTVLARGTGVLLRNADSTAAQEIDGNAIFARFRGARDAVGRQFRPSLRECIGSAAHAVCRQPYAGPGAERTRVRCRCDAIGAPGFAARRGARLRSQAAASDRHRRLCERGAGGSAAVRDPGRQADARSCAGTLIAGALVRVADGEPDEERFSARQCCIASSVAGRPRGTGRRGNGGLVRCPVSDPAGTGPRALGGLGRGLLSKSAALGGRRACTAAGAGFRALDRMAGRRGVGLPARGCRLRGLRAHCLGRRRCGHGTACVRAGNGTRIPLVSLVLLVALVGTSSIAAVRGVLDAAPTDAGLTQGYFDPLNSLRLFKPFLWALLVAPLFVANLRAAPATRPPAW